MTNGRREGRREGGKEGGKERREEGEEGGKLRRDEGRGGGREERREEGIVEVIKSIVSSFYGVQASLLLVGVFLPFFFLSQHFFLSSAPFIRRRVKHSNV